MKHNSNSPISDDAMDLLQQFLGYKLPKDYCSFLKYRGGESPCPNSFNFESLDYGGEVHFFYGILRTCNYDLVEKIKYSDGRFPPNFITIACDEGGNQICLGVKGPDRNKVYFWDHEFEADDGETPTKENMTLITHSFTDFINNLFERNYDE